MCTAVACEDGVSCWENSAPRRVFEGSWRTALVARGEPVGSNHFALFGGTASGGHYDQQCECPSSCFLGVLSMYKLGRVYSPALAAVVLSTLVQFIDANCGMIVQTVALLVVIIVAVPPMLAVIFVAAVFYVFQVSVSIPPSLTYKTDVSLWHRSRRLTEGSGTSSAPPTMPCRR